MINRRAKRYFVISLASAAILTGTISYYTYRGNDGVMADLPYELTKQGLVDLSSNAAQGNFAAAYRVGQYHLYRSLVLQQAERFYRMGVKCNDPRAITGLLVVLRDPRHDKEVDRLLAQLHNLDPKQGQSASEEIGLRRAERR